MTGLAPLYCLVNDSSDQQRLFLNVRSVTHVQFIYKLSGGDSQHKSDNVKSATSCKFGNCQVSNSLEIDRIFRGNRNVR